MTKAIRNLGTVDDHDHIRPLWSILGGLAVGFGWPWENIVQIQTPEACFLSKGRIADPNASGCARGISRKKAW